MILCVSLFAQPGIIKTREENKGTGKFLTMEQVILGMDVRPENAYYAWRPGTSDLTTVKENRLVATGMTGEDRLVTDLETLNSIAGTDMESFPRSHGNRKMKSYFHTTEYSTRRISPATP